MPKRLSMGLVAVIGAALFNAAPAWATEFCSIKKTPDGFTALREQPNAKGKLVARMRPGDEVMINNIVEQKNGWARVYWWKGGRFHGDVIKGIESADGQGWVNGKLIGDECG